MITGSSVYAVACAGGGGISGLKSMLHACTTDSQVDSPHGNVKLRYEQLYPRVLDNSTSTLLEGFALWGFSGVFQPFLGHNLNISLLISDVIPLSGRWSCRYLPESQRQNLNQGKNK